MAADIEIRMVLCVPVPWSQLSAGIKPSTEWSTDLAAMDLRLGFLLSTALRDGHRARGQSCGCASCSGLVLL